MNKKTGKPLSLIDHIKQSVQDILETPRGTRLLNRDYGSNIPYMIGGHYDAIDFSSEVIRSLSLFEKRIEVKKVVVKRDLKKRIILEIKAVHKSLGELTFEAFS